VFTVQISCSAPYFQMNGMVFQKVALVMIVASSPTEAQGQALPLVLPRLAVPAGCCTPSLACPFACLRPFDATVAGRFGAALAMAQDHRLRSTSLAVQTWPPASRTSPSQGSLQASTDLQACHPPLSHKEAHTTTVWVPPAQC
jgi:hypothetical protein